MFSRCSAIPFQNKSISLTTEGIQSQWEAPVREQNNTDESRTTTPQVGVEVEDLFLQPVEVLVQLESGVTGGEGGDESSAFTFSSSSSTADSELADQFDLLLADSNLVEMPLRRSRRLAAKPRVDYHGDQEVKDHVDGVRILHQQGAQIKVAQWLEEEKVNAFISHMSGIDPRREIDRFAAQLSREISPVPFEERTGLPDEGIVTERIVDNELFNVIEQQMKKKNAKIF